MASSSEAPWAQAMAQQARITPTEWTQIQQNLAQLGPAHQGGLLHQGSTIAEPPSLVVQVAALHTKVQRQITQLIDRLPMTIVVHIDTVSFSRASAGQPHRFVVVFDNQHALELTDINNFPSDKDLAQVALECP